MAGAAAAVGVMRALMLLKYPVNVLAVIPLVENIPSGMAYHVDDILTMYNGKTVEVKNTDAEGRLILADALTYAQEKGATRLIDLATLTGACVTALGTVRTGMIGNDQEWMNRFFSAATEVHEKIWQLPADEEYEKLLESDIADLRTSAAPKREPSRQASSSSSSSTTARRGSTWTSPARPSMKRPTKRASSGRPASASNPFFTYCREAWRPMIVDLHMHTTCSDGVYTPEQLTQMAVDAGLSVMAISDHDTVAAYDGSHRFAAGVRVIPAIEISSECDGEDVHILATASTRLTPACRLTARNSRNGASTGPWKSSTAAAV